VKPIGNIPQAGGKNISVERNRCACVSRKDIYARFQIKNFLQEVIELGRPFTRLSRICMQVRASHSGEKQRISRKQCLTIDKIAGAFAGVPRSMDCLEGRVAKV